MFAADMMVYPLLLLLLLFMKTIILILSTRVIFFLLECKSFAVRQVYLIETSIMFLKLIVSMLVINFLARRWLSLLDFSRGYSKCDEISRCQDDLCKFREETHYHCNSPRCHTATNRLDVMHAHSANFHSYIQIPESECLYYLIRLGFSILWLIRHKTNKCLCGLSLVTLCKNITY